MAARVGVEPTTLRLKVIVSTKASPRPTIIFISQLYLATLYVEIVLSIAAGSPVSLLVIRGCLQWDLN